MESLRSVGGTYLNSDAWKFTEKLESMTDSQISTENMALKNVQLIIEKVLPHRLGMLELLEGTKKEDVFMFVQLVRCAMTIFQSRIGEEYKNQLREFCSKHHKNIEEIIIKYKGTALKKTALWKRFQAYFETRKEHDYSVVLLDEIAILLFGKPWPIKFPKDRSEIEKADIKSPLTKEEKEPFQSLISDIRSFANNHTSKCKFKDFYPRRHLPILAARILNSVKSKIENMTLHEAEYYLGNEGYMNLIRQTLKDFAKTIFSLNNKSTASNMYDHWISEDFVDVFMKKYKVMLEAKLKEKNVNVDKVAF